MSKVTLIARILMGALFVFAGVGYFFFPTPEIPPGPLLTFNQGLGASTYFMPLLKVTEIVCGLLLLSGRFVPLALVILAPIIVNIVMVHTFLDRTTLPVAIVIGIFEVYLAFFSEHSPKIKALFQPK